MKLRTSFSVPCPRAHQASRLMGAPVWGLGEQRLFTAKLGEGVGQPTTHHATGVPLVRALVGKEVVPEPPHELLLKHLHDLVVVQIGREACFLVSTRRLGGVSAVFPISCDDGSRPSTFLLPRGGATTWSGTLLTPS